MESAVDLKSGILDEPILVGRESELAELHRHVDYAIAGKGGTVFVSGEAGSGKTRLTNEFLTSAKNKGVMVLSGWCLSNAAVPYFPFVEAFESFLAENEDDKRMSSQQLGLKTWLTAPSQPTELDNQEIMSPQAWKDQRFAAVTNELLFLSTEKPLILFIDDLHWADSASLSLLHYFSRAVVSERILILATFRSEEISSTNEGFAHPLLDTLRLMGREDLLKEVKLNNLSKPDVGRIAENMLRGNVGEELIEKLAEESRGNPLFVIESLRMLYENGALVQEKGHWRLAVDKLGIPTKVKDIILRRLSALKPNQRRTLDVASVIGDKFDPQLLGAVLNQDSLEVLETLNSVALSRSLVCVEGDYYRFDHAKSREVLYEEILLPLKKGYHERVGERIEALSQSAKWLPLSDLAYHYTQAGNRAKSIEYNLAAGKDALARFSNSEAIKHFKSVIQTIATSSDCFDQKIGALEGLGDAFFAAGLFEEATRTFENIAETAESKAAKLQALCKAVICCYWRGDSNHGLELADKAKAYELVDRKEYARLQLYKGFVEGRSLGKAEEAIEEMTAALTVFEEENSLPDIAKALAEISFAYPWVGRLEDSLSAALRSVAFYEELADLRQQAFAIGRLGTSLCMCGFFQEALNAYSRANKLDEKIGDYNTMAFHFMMSGLLLETLGDNKAAVTQSMKGLEAAEKTDALYAKSLCFANLVREYSKLGQIDRAEEYSNMAEKLFSVDVALRSNINAVAQDQISKAVLLLHKGRWKEASDIFEKYLTFNESLGKEGYAWALQKQGRMAEAKLQLEKAKKMRDAITVRFEHSNVRAYLAVTRKAETGEEIKVRLDIVNIGKRAAKISRIEDLVPFKYKISLLPADARIDGGSLDFAQKEIGALGTESIRLSLIPLEAGIFTVEPKAVYTDDAGALKTYAFRPITLTVKLKPSSPYTSALNQGETFKVEFGSEAAQKTFDFLVKAFNEDCIRKFPIERSGWRTLMDIVKQGKISKYSAYGSACKQGNAIRELEQSSLIEARIFTGERGRGGKILKVRVAYYNKNLRRYVAQGED
jgi:tetratricopeptide (TPR) repeat protein